MLACFHKLINEVPFPNRRVLYLAAVVIAVCSY